MKTFERWMMQHNISISELMIKTGVTRMTIWRWRQGQEPDQVAVRLLRALYKSFPRDIAPSKGGK